MMNSSEPKRYYVTTPIYYANGRPHIGNTYTTTIADFLTRYYKQQGYETFFLTGTDEHGDKVHQAAIKAGQTPQEFTDEVSEIFKRAWSELGLEYDRFIRTTDKQHKDVVQRLLQQIYDQGDIYFGEYGGNYCVGCERFLTDKELVDGKCPDHQTVPVFVKEKNYFFKMSKYQDRLIDFLTNVRPDFVRPERYRNEALAMLREPLEDLCISRPKARLTWGIELPFDTDYVTYVWFDALINYLSGIDYPNGDKFSRFWPVAEHLIAKDILKPHAIFWPTMLFAAGLEPFQHLNVHGYWVTPSGKMSKTVGNVVDPLAIKAEFGRDVYRYFVLREMVFGLDGTFSREALETRYSADLANNLGNLVSRMLAMVVKYRNSAVPEPSAYEAEEQGLKDLALSTATEIREFIRKMELNRAVERLWALIDATNVYIQRTAPWVLAKAEKSGGGPERLSTVLYTQLESLRIIATILSPFMPDTAERILNAIGLSPDALTRADNWGELRPGTKISPVDQLFPRIERSSEDNNETKAMTEEAGPEPVRPPTRAPQQGATGTDAAQTGASANPNTDNLISYDQFSQVQLRVGQILSAERVPKSDKLVKLSVDIGAQSPRQIVAGIGKHYAPEVLVGRKIVVVANLKPARLMGQTSEGMLLAASDDAGNLELISPGLVMPAGSVVK
jgi:methionyl-tRNA synthetase